MSATSPWLSVPTKAVVSDRLKSKVITAVTMLSPCSRLSASRVVVPIALPSEFTVLKTTSPILTLKSEAPLMLTLYVNDFLLAFTLALPMKLAYVISVIPFNPKKGLVDSKPIPGRVFCPKLRSNVTSTVPVNLTLSRKEP